MKNMPYFSIYVLVFFYLIMVEGNDRKML